MLDVLDTEGLGVVIEGTEIDEGLTVGPDTDEELAEERYLEEELTDGAELGEV